MNVDIRKEYAWGSVSVFVYDTIPNGYRVLRLRDDSLEWVDVDQGARIEASEHALFSLPVDIFEDIVSQARKGGKADDIALDALQDARETRDRLLAVIERQVNPCS